jgi:hypothetical protein
MKDEGGRMKVWLFNLNHSTNMALLSSFILPPSSLLFRSAAFPFPLGNSGLHVLRNSCSLFTVARAVAALHRLP